MEVEKQLSQIHKAINENKPWIVIGILKVRSELITRVSTSGDTVLMMAITGGGWSSAYIAKIIEMAPEEGLCTKDRDGNTVLHMVAMVGNVELAELLLTKCPSLLLIRNNSGDLPIHIAVKQGHRDMKDYLLKMTKQQGYNDPFAGVNSQDLLRSAISAGMNDVIIALSYNNPDLVLKGIDEEEQRRDELAGETSELLEAIENEVPTRVESILENHPALSTASLTTSGDTPIKVAAKRGYSIRLIRRMIEEIMSDEALAKTDNSGNTLLHTVAMLGSTQLAKLLLAKSPDLLRIRNNVGDVPICVAIKQGHKDMTDFLFKAGKERYNGDPFAGAAASADVLCSAIRAGMYDVACFTNNRHPNLAVEDSSVLEALVEDPSPFRATPFSNWNGALATTLKGIFGIDSRPNVYVTTMLTDICSNALRLPAAKASWLVREPFLIAAQNGIETVISKILDYHPNAIHFVDEENHSIFHLAVMYRQENIFKFAYHFDVEVSRSLLPMPDKDGNNVLHLTGYTACQNRLDQCTSIVLQMQRELKWFKELENLLSPQDIKLKNKFGKTPLTVFNKEHKDMVAAEVQWMTSMASACSVAAPLIATVAFGAAITVPGGNNSNGLPMFSNHKTFKVFAVSDALALFASIACVLSFLSIFTSRYGVDDFLYALPNRLIIGLISLLISTISLMIAFGTTLFLAFGQENFMILIPIIVFSCAPVTLYAILQLPSLFNIIKSTYGRKLLA